ncbi:MAG: hypothetical protein AAB414_00070 [Patescibacteria group bacterium]
MPTPEVGWNILDTIRIHPANKGRDLSVVDLAERAIRASGLVIPGLSGIDGIIAAHKAPVRITRETKKVAEWRRQTDHFIELGFADELKYKDSEKYRLTIPKFFRQPRNWKGVYDYLVAYEGRIPHARICKLAGITQYADANKITDEADNLPPVYTAYAAGTSELVIGTFEQAMAETPKYGVAGTMIFIDMFYLSHPQLFDDEHGRWRDAGRSRFGAGSVPYLYVDGDGPGVDASWAGYPTGGWRLLSRGNKIGT